MARPSSYTEEIAARICEELAHGKSLVNICIPDDMPSDRTVYRWLDADESFRQRYARAREEQADFYAAQVIELADTCRIGKKITEKADGSEEIVTADMVERSRLQIDARKWYAGKLAPKKYGEKVAVTGEDGGPVVFTLKKIGE